MSNSRRTQSHRQSATIAFSGMLTALSVVLMLTGGIVPIMTYISPLVSGVLLLPILLEFGKKYAWISFAVTALLTLLIGADREAAFFYLFLGYYPIVKWQIERLHGRKKQYLLKILLFTVATAALYGFLGFVLHLDAMIAEFQEMGTGLTISFFAMMLICLLLYDRLLLPLCMMYELRIKPRMKWLRK